jgi:PAS domain S-box-containing protein
MRSDNTNQGPERLSADVSAARLRAIVDAATDGIVSANPAGDIIDINRAVERMFGYAASELLGQPLTVLMPARFHAPHRSGLARFLATRTPRVIGHTIELVGVRKDGGEFPLELSLAVCETPEGLIFTGILRDVTDRQLAEEERQKLLREREATAEASRIKDEFLATLSHELRTPLNAMLGWTRLIREQHLGGAALAKAIETVERNAHAQARLVEDLLDVSQIVTGRLRLDVQPIDLIEVVESAIDVIRPAADAKAIGVDTVFETRALPMTGDPDRLQQAIWNVLSNAVKFSAANGRVEVRVSTGDRHARVCVRDTGLGISPGFLPHVFDRFRQADSSYSRSTGGLGLGLAIVRSIVEMHDGTVAATSPGEGRGATFSLTLPTTAADAHARRVARPGPDVIPGRLDGVRIVLVDDQADERELLRSILTTQGADVELAGSVLEAMEKIERLHPAVVVSDLAMPGEDGYALLRRVRALPDAGRNVPVIAITAHARAEDRIRALEVGFHSYVPKPIDHARLVRAVQHAFAQTPT